MGLHLHLNPAAVKRANLRAGPEGQAVPLRAPSTAHRFKGSTLRNLSGDTLLGHKLWGRAAGSPRARRVGQYHRVQAGRYSVLLWFR